MPAQVKAAFAVSDRMNLRDYPGGMAAAIGAGQPLYAPPGNYELPSNLRLAQPLDLLGEVGDPPVFTWGEGDAFIPGSAPVRFQGCRFARGRGYLVNMDKTEVEVPYIGILDCTFEGTRGVIGWPTIHPLPGSRLRQLEVRRVRATNVKRGIFVQGGATVRFDIEDYACNGYRRFGLLIGPAGPASRDHQAEMQSGTIRRATVLNGSGEGVNSGGIYVAGRNVELADIHVEGLGDGTRSDTEGLYTKVVGLRASNIRLINAGGDQAFFACKGAATKGPIGSDGIFENMEMICTGAHQGVGVWYQFERAAFAKVKTIGLTRQALIMHKASRGALTIREWSDEGARRNGSVFKLRGSTHVEFIGCAVSPRPAELIENVDGAVEIVQSGNEW